MPDWIGSGAAGVERTSNGFVPALTSNALGTPSPSKSAAGSSVRARWKPDASPPHAEPPFGSGTSTSGVASTCHSLIALPVAAVPAVTPNTHGSPLPSIAHVVNVVAGGGNVATITPAGSTFTQLPAKPWFASHTKPRPSTAQPRGRPDVIGVVDTIAPSGSICSSADCAWFATHTLPFGSAVGNEKPKPAAVDVYECVLSTTPAESSTVSVCTVDVFEWKPATHTWSSALTTTPIGDVPDGSGTIVCTAPALSTLITELLDRLTTQTKPWLSIATLCGNEPTANDAVVVPVGSVRVITLPLLPAHTLPAVSTATPNGFSPTGAADSSTSPRGSSFEIDLIDGEKFGAQIVLSGPWASAADATAA